MVYVTPADDYEQALDYAFDVYPEELKDISRDRVQFSVNVKNSRSSRIASMAWNAVVVSLTRFEILDITVRKGECPPRYSSATTSEQEYDEKTGGYLQPSPNFRSTPSPTPSKKGVARGWMDKLL